MNTLISIGYIGLKRCYLNLTEDEAIERYCKFENMTRNEFDENVNISVRIIQFDDEFSAYDVWD